MQNTENSHHTKSDNPLTGTELWLSEFSKCAYETYSKIDSINDRTRTLTAPLTALGAGYIFELSTYTNQNTTADTLLFFLPMGVGAMLVIASIYTILWALIPKQTIHTLASPKEYLDTIQSWGDNADADAERDIIKKRILAATSNFENLKKRGVLLSWGAYFALGALTLLVISTPQYVNNRIKNQLEIHEQGQR